jgi:hypothetical protein
MLFYELLLYNMQIEKLNITIIIFFDFFTKNGIFHLVYKQLNTIKKESHHFRLVIIFVPFDHENIYFNLYKINIIVMKIVDFMNDLLDEVNDYKCLRVIKGSD